MKRYILKWAAVILSALCLTVLLTVGVSAAERNIENDDALRVGYGNLVFKDTIYLRYAVSTETYSAEDMVLLVWTEPKSSVDEYLYGTQSMTLSPTGTVGISGVTHAVFDYKGLTAKQMTDYIYARVCIPSEEATEAKYGAVVKYSVLQYSYSMLGKTGSNGTTNEKLIKLLNAMLNYGAAAQEYTEYKTDWLANDAFYEVKVAGGTLPDGTTTGLYKKDSKVMLTADAAADGCKFAGWQNSAGETVSTDEAYEITVGEKNEVYMAVYEEAVKYSEGLEFLEKTNGTSIIIGIGNCKDTDLVIPSMSPEGNVVTSIFERAFIYCDQLQSVTIPNSVTSIDRQAFFECINLKSVTIPDGVITIGEGAFRNCYNLTSISIPNSVSSIGSGLFSGCISLEDVIIPNSVTLIDNGTFYECSNLKTVVIGANVNYIGSYAFYRCSNLVKFDIKGDSNNIKNSNTGVGEYAFYECKSLSSIKLPEGITSIGREAFRNCRNLVSFGMPEAVTSIEEGAFSGCVNLQNIVIPDNITIIKNHTFYDCKSIETIKIPDSVTDIGESAFHGCSSLLNIILPDSVNNIATFAFSNCTSLKNLSIGRGIERISWGAFGYCSSLESLVVPDNVKYIEGNAFVECRSLNSITLGNGVINIGYRAFSGCSNIKNMFFPDSVTNIDEGAFYTCSSLIHIKFGENSQLQSISSDVFRECKSLVSIVIPVSVTHIDVGAFDLSKNITDVFYTGTEEQWAAITIGTFNAPLLTATIHYNYTPDP